MPAPGFPSARFIAGLSQAAFVLLHPRLCWSWLQDPVVGQRFRIIEYVALLSGVVATAGLLRSVVIGVDLPVFGTWRMPLADALSYYLIVLAWLLSLLVGGTWLLQRLAKFYGGLALNNQMLGLLAFSMTPFILSGLGVLLPFESLRAFSSAGMFYGMFLFIEGTRWLEVVPGNRRGRFATFSIGLMLIGGTVFLSLFLGLLVPDYPFRALSEPPLSIDVLKFKRTVEELAELY